MAKNIGRIARKHGAMPMTGCVTRSWEKGRFNDPYLRDTLMGFSVITDALECTVNWFNMAQVHRDVRAVSHHHGIGKMFAPWLEGYMGEKEYGAVKVLKDYFDPNGMMNLGGTLGLDLPQDEKKFLNTRKDYR